MTAIMIHRAKNLSSVQKTLLEGLLGRAVSEDEAISIRALGSGSPPRWLETSWDSAERSNLNELSMEEIDAEIRAVRKQRQGQALGQ